MRAFSYADVGDRQLEHLSGTSRAPMSGQASPLDNDLSTCSLATPASFAYRFALAAGYVVVGTEDAFAVLLDDLDGRKWIAVFGEMRVAQDVHFEHQAAQDALEMAKKLNAVFSVVDGAVRCEADGVETTGTSYVDAAMKAVVLHQLLHKADCQQVGAGS